MRRFWWLFLCIAVGTMSARDQGVQSTGAAVAQIDQRLIQGMRWRLVGPFRGGRVLAVTGVAGEPDVYYMGAVAGGVWKTTDGGGTWNPLFEHQSVSSIGSIAIAPSDSNIIYVGSGEACIRGDISYGDGVYKSTDAGKTWKNVGLRDTRHIGAVIVDPMNPNLVLVAALGHAYGPNAERGVFRSTDGGNTWSKVLYKNEKTGASDIVFDPKNSSIVYASLWEVSRTPYSLSSGGPGSGLYKSTDGGVLGRRLEGTACPGGILGRIGIAVSGADSNRVYALIEAKEGGLYRSDDAGEKWTKVSDEGRIRQRAWYFTHIFADPKSVGHSLCFEYRLAALDRRRKELRPVSAAWRSPRTVDRSDESPAHDQRQRRRRDHLRRRRQNLDAPGQSAHRTVLSRHHRQPLPVLHLRGAAGQHHHCHRQHG